MDEFRVWRRAGTCVKMRLPSEVNDDDALWGMRNGIPLRWEPSSLLTMAEAGDEILRIDAWTLCDQRQATLCMGILCQIPVALIQIIQDYACRTIEDCKEGDYVDAADRHNVWYVGKIHSLLPEAAHIHFVGWSSTFDAETIPFPSERLAPPGSKTGIYSGVDILTS